MTSHKIRVLRERSRIDSAGRIKIRIKEKPVYTCNQCANRYSSLHYFCPQCLGVVAAEHPKRAGIKLLSIPEERKGETIALLQTLSGKDFDFARTLQTLPCVLIRNSEIAVLQEWKQVLEANGSKVTIEESSPKVSRRIKAEIAPLFDSDATLPCFLQASLIAGIRSVGASLSNASIRLKWVETVLKAFTILEAFYKSDPSGRILFSDFLLQIEQQFHEAVAKYPSRYKHNPEGFEETILKIRSSLDEMESEIQAVRARVEQQL